MRTFSALCLIVFGFLPISAQNERSMTLHGAVQSDILFPQSDDAIGAEKDGDVQTNTYLDLQLQSQRVDAGLRVEYLEHPLPGFEHDFNGWGVPHFWVKARLGCAELTAGTFYEQFGSGLILRTYEERSLGIDNSLLGGRLTLKPTNGVTVKVLSGRQRRYWAWNKSLVSGIDSEVSLSQWLHGLQKSDTELMVGFSWVNKYECQEDVFISPTYKLNLPEFVNAWEVRTTLNKGPWNLLAEYARKTQDPSFDNQYCYESGSAVLFSGSYSKKGLSILLQAKRSENMSLRSQRSMLGTSSFINHLPAFTQDHTYALAALYPYATQLAGGEWAWQAEGGYHFKRATLLGGRYGMNVKVNFSHVRWGGNTYYQDFDLQLNRQLTRDFKLTVMYMNQHYNKTVVEGEGGMVRSNIFIAEGKCRITPKSSLRSELQYLSTADDQGDWAYGLIELSLAPHWMLSASDMYNVGDTHLHFYQGSVAYSTRAHRLQIGYGRTRAGYNCAGGVCRYVPASKGVTVIYNYNF